MAAIDFDGVTKIYGDGTLAVDALDLTIQDGEFMVFVGPSGCGKTTALRMVAGLEEISSGTVAIGGKTVNDISPKDRDIAMVFQNYALYPHMTVAANLAFGLKLRHIGKAELDRRVRDAAAALDLEDHLERKPKALSGGQRQRVALGRAIVREPAAFLMDEPLSNLDAALRVQTRAEILKLQKRLGTTTIYVTHDQVEAMTMGDRIAVMRKGVLQQIGTPEELYTRPANTFVATFIGSPAMNLVPLRRSGLGPDSLLAGFRPEHIRVGSSAQATGELRLRGRGRGRRVPRRRAPRAHPLRRALARGQAARRRTPSVRRGRALRGRAQNGDLLRRQDRSVSLTLLRRCALRLDPHQPLVVRISAIGTASSLASANPTLRNSETSATSCTRTIAAPRPSPNWIAASVAGSRSLRGRAGDHPQEVLARDRQEDRTAEHLKLVESAEDLDAVARGLRVVEPRVEDDLLAPDPELEGGVDALAQKREDIDDRILVVLGTGAPWAPRGCA